MRMWCRVLDSKADHATKCKRGGDLIRRHNNIRDVIYHMCRQAGLSPVLEKTNMSGGQE